MTSGSPTWMYIIGAIAGLLTVVVALGASLIELGAQGKQIEINTQRLSLVEVHDTETRQIEAKDEGQISYLRAKVGLPPDPK